MKRSAETGISFPAASALFENTSSEVCHVGKSKTESSSVSMPSQPLRPPMKNDV
jgi:hypothetical protein